MVVTGYGCLALSRVPFFKGREHHLKLTSHLSPYCRWLENENKAGVCTLLQLLEFLLCNFKSVKVDCGVLVVYCKIASRNTCFYSKNQPFKWFYQTDKLCPLPGASNQDFTALWQFCIRYFWMICTCTGKYLQTTVQGHFYILACHATAKQKEPTHLYIFPIVSPYHH